MRIINAPSLANCNLLEMGRDVEELVCGGADWFHIDIMDGHYVPNISLPLRLVADLKQKYPDIKTDIHLMVTNPAGYLEDLSRSGADYVSFHMDATNFSLRLLERIRSLGMKAGVIINPSQQIGVLEPIINCVDYVVLMSVEPGYAGQRFMPSAIPRLKELIQMRWRSGCDFLISIDGGVDYPHAIECARLGAEVYVTGIFTVFQQPDGISAACRRFKKTLTEACG